MVLLALGAIIDMAEYTTRTVTTKRMEVVLPNPTNWTEVGKAFAYVNQNLPEKLRGWDDTVTVEANEEEIIIWWKVEE